MTRVYRGQTHMPRLSLVSDNDNSNDSDDDDSDDDNDNSVLADLLPYQ
jgi:hypothetical protein